MMCAVRQMSGEQKQRSKWEQSRTCYNAKDLKINSANQHVSASHASTVVSAQVDKNAR